LRLYREPTPIFTDEDTPFEIGKANVLCQGKDVTIVACGAHVGFCLDWVREWKDEFSAEVIDCHTIKPLDSTIILNSVKKTGAIVTVEDHLITGGLGSAVAELLADNLYVPFARVGLSNYAPSGPYYELINKVGIGKNDVKRAIMSVLRKQNRK